MPRFRLDFVQLLARQMTFAPVVVREKQLQAAESLLLSIEPGKAYPPAYVVYRVTAFRPETPPTDLATGLALQHDLGLLIEQVSDTLDDYAADRAEPVLQIDDLVSRFNVTSKTIQRWRRRGLAARRFVFPDGKRRVGFRLSVVEQFFAAHFQSLQTTVNCAEIDTGEWATILRHARRLSADPRRPADEIAHRIGRLVGRSALAVEAELRKHDAEHPAAAVLMNRPAGVTAGTAARVRELVADGLSIERIAVLVGLPRSTAFRVALADRLARIAKRRIKFLDDPLYHQPDAECVLEHLLAQQPILAEPAGEKPASMRELSPELRSLCDHAVLTPTQERALFLQFNFRKFQAAQARHRLDPARLRRRQLAKVERLIDRAAEVRNRIVRANLRLVVSVAKKHTRPHLPLPELVNEGSLTIMRAVESFDTRRGHKFSTYATLALMKGFARTVGRSTAGPVVFGLGIVSERACGRGNGGVSRVDNTDRVDHLLARLSTDESLAVRRQFGLAGRPLDTDQATALQRRLNRVAIEKLRASN